MGTFTLNGMEVEFHEELDTDPDLVVRFKNVKTWTNVTKMVEGNSFIFVPDTTALELIMRMTRTSDGSAGFWDQAEKKQGSNSFLRRLIQDGGVRFNGRILKPTDKVDFPIFSIVVFPKSDRHRTTML
jgi:hypothetical protein